MKFAQVFALIVGAAVPALSATLPLANLTYDTRYDDPTTRLSSTVCSDPNGPLGDYTTLGDLPVPLNVVGAFAVEGYGSAECGSCWALSTEHKVAYVTAINSAPNGFTSSWFIENFLTDLPKNQIPSQVLISYQKVDRSFCGFI